MLMAVVAISCLAGGAGVDERNRVDESARARARYYFMEERGGKPMEMEPLPTNIIRKHIRPIPDMWKPAMPMGRCDRLWQAMHCRPDRNC